MCHLVKKNFLYFSERDAQTVNDVLVGVSSAALSKYYFRKLGEYHAS